MAKLSVCVITKNEEAMITRCLASVRWADEIIVVDSGSTDRTVALAEQAGANVSYNAWPGWAKQKNRAISLASHDWILSLDADEWLPDTAEKIIREAMNCATADGYYVGRRTYFLGTWIRHGGWYPDRQIRLFKKSVTHFEEVPVHEKVMPPQRSAVLDLDIWHESYVSFAQYFAKIKIYTRAQAEQQADQKFLLLKLFAKPVYRFVQNYVVQHGFLDGAKGLLLACLRSRYEWRVIVEIFRLRRKKRSALQGRYRVHNPVLHALLRISDRMLALFAAPPSQVPPPVTIQRILLANLAHLGDVVISTAMLDVLTRNFPGAQIGMLVGSWSKNIVEHHPSIARVHTVDHWKINRSSKNISQKLKQHASTARAALREMRQMQYDVAIDLSFHFPNAIPLLWKAKIPRRIGYTSGGFGPLLTDSLEWTDRDQHVAAYHLALLQLLPIAGVPDSLRPALPSAAAVPKALHIAGCTPARYIVCHLGAGAPVKEWPLAQWALLIQRLLHNHHVVVLTGAGEREERKIQQLGIQSDQCVNLCGQLTWHEFAATIQQAALIISSDSVAGHIASAYDVPSITIGHGINNSHHWKPLSDRNVFVTVPTPCAPCYRSNGCPEMTCLNNIEVQEIVSIVTQFTRRDSHDV